MTTITDLANPGISDLPIYEPGRPIEDVARELGFADANDIVKLASNENALGPSPKALAAMRDAAGQMHRYPDGGAFYLKQKLAEKLDVEPSMLLPGNGSNEILELLAHVFLAPGASIVMAEYAFVVYRLVAASHRCRVHAVAMPGLTHDLPAMLSAIDEDTRMVFIANPNNPTGTKVDQAQIDAFMDQVPERVVVCFDEAYFELLPVEQRPDCLKYVRDGRNVYVVRTFSKAYGLAGLRIGYAVGSPEAVSLLHRVRQPFNVNAMALAAALAALDDEEHVTRTRELVQAELGWLAAELTVRGIEYVPSVANFMLVKVGAGRDCFAALQQAGVVVRPMDGYRLPDYVRVTIGTREENGRFLSALDAWRGK